VAVIDPVRLYEIAVILGLAVFCGVVRWRIGAEGAW
jgi:hypothetical protein